MSGTGKMLCTTIATFSSLFVQAFWRILIYFKHKQIPTFETVLALFKYFILDTSVSLGGKLGGKLS